MHKGSFGEAFSMFVGRFWETVGDDIRTCNAIGTSWAHVPGTCEHLASTDRARQMQMQVDDVIPLATDPSLQR